VFLIAEIKKIHVYIVARVHFYCNSET